ncbi:MAG: hypothetical protein KDC80_09245 [Saprospiraceae bacterium]|nr:hypothetical protein [Saprospiraceae bacterium]
MEDINLEKYRQAWRDEGRFEEPFLTEDEVQKFIGTESKDITSRYRRSISFDMMLKVVLALGFAILALLIPNQIIKIVNVTLLVISCVMIIWEWKIYESYFMTMHNVGQTLSVIKKHLELHRIYFRSVFIIAFSAPLFFISGSTFYLYMKYGSLPDLRADDFIVFSAGVVLSFVLSAFSQARQATSQVREWEACLVELQEDNPITSLAAIGDYRKRQLRKLIIISILSLVGMAVFLYLLWKIS